MSQRNLRVTTLSNQEVNEMVSNDNAGSVKVCNYEKFIKKLDETSSKINNRIYSENGALEYASTGSALVDFNARATEFRNATADVIADAAAKAYAENPVDFIKLIFQTGDIRNGKGERHIFNACMDYLVSEHPLVAKEVLSLIPEYTRWDYLVRQTISRNNMISEYATSIVLSQLAKDIEAVNGAKEGETVSISLLAKWMPSLQTKKEEDKAVVRHLLKKMHLKERDYRKTLSLLRGHLNIIEKAMSIKSYDDIDMEKLSSKQQLRYAQFFKRVMAERRHEYIQAVLRGEKKMNASVLNPLDIVHEYIDNIYESVAYNEDYEALWSLIPDRTSGNGNTLVIRDGSGSMTHPIGAESSATMLEASTSMAIYCAEHLTGAFKDKFITFSSTPMLVDMSECDTLADKLNLLLQYDDYTNTDLEATFDLVLKVAVDNGLSQEEIPSYLLILSDMEFDRARDMDYRLCRYGRDAIEDRDTLFDTIRKKWNKAGYEMPTLVFWQLNGERTIYPEIDAKNGIIFLSGFSTNELLLVMAGEYESSVEISEEEEIIDEETGEKRIITKTYTEKVVLSPIEQLKLKLSDSRYDAVEEAALKGIKLETA